MVTRQMSHRAIFNPATKIWHGVKKINPFEFRSVGEAILELLTSHPDHLMQIGDDDAEVYICERMKRTVVEIMELLKFKNLVKGDIAVLLLAEHDHRITAVLIACIFLGVKFCLLKPEINSEYMRYFVDLKLSRILIALTLTSSHFILLIGQLKTAISELKPKFVLMTDNRLIETLSENFSDVSTCSLNDDELQRNGARVNLGYLKTGVSEDGLAEYVNRKSSDSLDLLDETGGMVAAPKCLDEAVFYTFNSKDELFHVSHRQVMRQMT